MSGPLKIRVEPSGEDLSLRLSGPGLPQEGRLLARKRYQLSEEEADQLRRGDAAPDIIARIRAELTEWFFG
jgi:hypothetical protein